MEAVSVWRTVGVKEWPGWSHQFRWYTLGTLPLVFNCAFLMIFGNVSIDFNWWSLMKFSVSGSGFNHVLIGLWALRWTFLKHCCVQSIDICYTYLNVNMWNFICQNLNSGLYVLFCSNQLTKDETPPGPCLGGILGFIGALFCFPEAKQGTHNSSRKLKKWCLV